MLTNDRRVNIRVKVDQITTYSFAIANIMSHLECIGNTIIGELKGLQRDQLKQRLFSSYRSNTTTRSHLSFSPTRRSLRDVLDAIRSFDDYKQRQCRSIAVGQDLDTLAMIPKSEKNTAISNDSSRRLTKLQQTEKYAPASNPVSARVSSTVPRTICTRSSTLKTSHDSQELVNQGEQVDHFDDHHLLSSHPISNTQTANIDSNR